MVVAREGSDGAVAHGGEDEGEGKDEGTSPGEGIGEGEDGEDTSDGKGTGEGVGEWGNMARLAIAALAPTLEKTDYLVLVSVVSMPASMQLFKTELGRVRGQGRGLGNWDRRSRPWQGFQRR